MRWIVNLEGGPKRVNHAAVEVNNKIYSFGGYCSGTRPHKNEPIDIHVLNTETLRWNILPYNVENPTKSADTSGKLSEISTIQRPRARSVAELHPLGQLRYVRPPLSSLARNSNDDGYMDEYSVMGSIDSSPTQSYEDSIDSEELSYINVEQEEIEELAHLSSLQLHIDDSDYEDEYSAGFYEFARSLEEENLSSDESGNSSLPESGAPLLGNDEQTRNNKVPYQRYGHTVVGYRGKCYLWGGRNDMHGSSDVLHEYNPILNAWSLVKVSGDLIPPSRDGHTAVVSGDSMYIFGGFEENYQRFSQETYVFNFITRKWLRLNTEGDVPQHRDFHTACVLKGKMYIFGGRSDEQGQYHSDADMYCKNLYALDLNTNVWTLLKTIGKGPSGRRSHSVWTINDCLYFFGGYDSNNKVHFDDLHEFNPATNEWQKISASNPSMKPFARRRHCSVKVKNRIFIFGGTMPTRDDKKDTLIDLSDLCILDYAPKLSTMCYDVIIKNKLNYDCLPETLKNELLCLSTPNNIKDSAMRRAESICG